jgi:tetratricopeptide (TPR) repeat protein
MGRSTYFLTQVHVVTTYVRLIVAPYGLSLDHDYALTRAPDLATAGKGLFLASLLVLAVRARKRSPLPALGILWFFATLLIESSVFPIRDVIFEHRTYLPSAGLILAGVAAIARAVPAERTFVVVIAIAAAALGGTTVARNRVWRDEITLWTDCVRKAPRKARPRANLAYAYMDRGEKEKALESMRTAVRLGDSFPEDLVTLAEIAYGLDESREAMSALRSALAIRPDYARARRNLALVLSDAGESAEALQEAEEAVRREPDEPSGWILLARLRLDAGHAGASLEAASEAEERGGDPGDAALLRARSLAVLGDAPGAVAALAAWNALGGGGSPEDAARAIHELRERGHPREAVSGAAFASSAFPGDARFPYFAGAILVDVGAAAEAVPWLREALRRSPADAESRSLLERAVRQAGRGRDRG